MNNIHNILFLPCFEWANLQFIIFHFNTNILINFIFICFFTIILIGTLIINFSIGKKNQSNTTGSGSTPNNPESDPNFIPTNPIQPEPDIQIIRDIRNGYIDSGDVILGAKTPWNSPSPNRTSRR